MGPVAPTIREITGACLWMPHPQAATALKSPGSTSGMVGRLSMLERDRYGMVECKELLPPPPLFGFPFKA